MAQDPDQLQPGAEARADDISMDGMPTEQEIAIAVNNYLQMKDGMDKRIESYSISKYQLNKMTKRKLEQWAKTNCESVMKLMGQQPNKTKRVELLYQAIKNQRKLDLKLLQTCRDDALDLGVPANLLPWTYGELDDGLSNKKDKNKEKEKNNHGNNDNNKKKQEQDNKKKEEEKKKKELKKKKKESLSKRMDTLYSSLETLKKEYAELGEDDEKDGPRGAPDSTNGGGDRHISLDYNAQMMQTQNKNLKSRIVNQLNGAYRALPAKDVS